MSIKPLRQATLAIVLKENHSFLIGSSPRDGGYKFPQGGLNTQETPLAGLLREIKEELGTTTYEGDIITKLSQTFVYAYPKTKPYSKIYSGQELHVFVVKYREDMIFEPQDDEFEELIWIQESDMKLYNFEHRGDAYLSAVLTMTNFITSKK